MTSAEKARRYLERRYNQIDQMPKIPCACGCGESIPPINKQLKPARYKAGHYARIAGVPYRFQQGDSESARRGAEALRAAGKLVGPGNPRWRGGEYQDRRGYVRSVVTPEQGRTWPTARRRRSGGSVIQRSHKVWNLAHPDDLVAKGYEVHHINGVTDDDRPENLLKLTKAAHVALHVANGWHRGPRPGGRKTVCINGHPYDEFRRYAPSGKNSWCIECERRKAARYRTARRASMVPRD